MRRALLLPFAALGLLLVLGLAVVWQRAALVHLGAEVAALRAREARLDEERQALRMALSRLSTPGQLVGKQPKDAWVMKDERTPELIRRVRTPVLKADVQP